ncbi:sulfotransferase [Paraglaciecola chathamensis]|uniref:sulfotransferase family protein n=1 Tax=Paraglaciecola chathamensis TaxID=368405 RepID=UPI002711A153|nr:sulfotransferase [Paraglaciecola chathamensis]MDO6838801.1 sulfotransferase [Paraglaciecola chathamensis]
MNKKIFCVGLNKTGTSSLHDAFLILGIKSVHFKGAEDRNIKDIILSNYLAGHNVLKGLEHYEAFSDWDLGPSTVDIVKEFDKQYPNSKFILNIRDLDGWLNSREKHVKRNQERKRKNPDADIQWLTLDREGWAKQFNNHYDQVTKHFVGKEGELLVFDVTKGDGWEKLCPFLEVPIPTTPFPKQNVAAHQKSFVRKVLRKLKRIVKS